MLPEILVAEPDALAERLAALFADDGGRALAARGTFTVAIPGGSVAERFFPRLARLPFDWSRIELFWTDERAVPPSDPESNFGLARRLWLEPAAVPAGRIHRMRADTTDLDRAAAAYEDDLRHVLGQRARLDLVLLGVGPDGHVCSLFPGHALLAEERRWVAPVWDAPKPPARRLTLTLSPLLAAERVVIAALGNAKARVLQQALERPDAPLPVARVAHQARHVLLLLDAPAAGRAPA